LARAVSRFEVQRELVKHRWFRILLRFRFFGVVLGMVRTLVS
jgi:hypothetical protein